MATPILIGSVGGEYMDSVIVLEWMVSIGDAVTAGDPIATVETAKAATEVAAPCDGVLTAIFAEVGSEIALTECLGLIGKDTDDDAYDRAPGKTREPTARSAPDETLPGTVMPGSPAGRIIASPAARKAAASARIDLSQIQPSSPTGRIKLRDLERAGKNDVTAEYQASAPPAPAVSDQPGPLNLYRSGPKDGVPVVLLHGFASDAQSWHPIESELARTHQVIRIDLPNHGRSPQRRLRDFRTLAREIVQTFDDLHIGQAHIVGHSLGGACALALADIRPRKVQSLSLIAPGGLGPVINGDFIDGVTRASRAESLRPWLKAMVADEDMITDEFVRAAMASRQESALRQAQALMADDLFPDSVQSFDLRPALQRLECPASIVWGKADRILPWRQALAAPGRMALHLFERVGHAPQLECPEEVMQIIGRAISAGG